MGRRCARSHFTRRQSINTHLQPTPVGDAGGADCHAEVLVAGVLPCLQSDGSISSRPHALHTNVKKATSEQSAGGGPLNINMKSTKRQDGTQARFLGQQNSETHKQKLPETVAPRAKVAQAKAPYCLPMESRRFNRAGEG